MARKPVTKKRRTTRAKAEAGREARGRVITFRVTHNEIALIQKAADRCPLARYSRDAVLAKATADSK